MPSARPAAEIDPATASEFRIRPSCQPCEGTTLALRNRGRPLIHSITTHRVYTLPASSPARRRPSLDSTWNLHPNDLFGLAGSLGYRENTALDPQVKNTRLRSPLLDLGKT